MNACEPGSLAQGLTRPLVPTLVSCIGVCLLAACLAAPAAAQSVYRWNVDADGNCNDPQTGGASPVPRGPASPTARAIRRCSRMH
jgi:hypothetical protein